MTKKIISLSMLASESFAINRYFGGKKHQYLIQHDTFPVLITLFANFAGDSLWHVCDNRAW